MTKGYLYAFFFLLTSNYCFGQGGNDRPHQYWIETGYLDCIKKNLPCDCERWGLPPKGIHYSLDSIDSSYFGRYRIVNYQNQGKEGISFDIISLMADIVKQENKEYTANIKIINDSLYYFYYEDSTEYIFISTKTDTWNIVDSLGIQRIDHILTKNGHNRLSKYLNSDSLECYCDLQLGYNFIAVDNGTFNQEKWSVEIHENQLVLYKIKGLKVKRFTEYRKSHFPHRKKTYKKFKLKNNYQ